jgi:hypothetical protein
MFRDSSYFPPLSSSILSIRQGVFFEMFWSKLISFFLGHRPNTALPSPEPRRSPSTQQDHPFHTRLLSFMAGTTMFSLRYSLTVLQLALK